MASAYPWLKSFHIIFLVSWYAGLFYLPRLFVHHAMSEDPATRQRLEIMERKLYLFVTPWAALTVALGLIMLFGYWDAFKTQGWMHAKLALVLLLVIYHFWCGHLVKAFRNGPNPHTHVWFRWFNEIPLVFLVLIVILVIVRPF
jgi:protoporphyrinogen IX oxidase